MFRESCVQNSCKWCDSEGTCQKNDSTEEINEISNNEISDVERSKLTCPACFEQRR